jgi:hypothetical protein
LDGFVRQLVQNTLGYKLEQILSVQKIESAPISIYVALVDSPMIAQESEMADPRPILWRWCTLSQLKALKDKYVPSLEDHKRLCVDQGLYDQLCSILRAKTPLTGR